MGRGFNAVPRPTVGSPPPSQGPGWLGSRHLQISSAEDATELPSFSTLSWTEEGPLPFPHSTIQTLMGEGSWCKHRSLSSSSSSENQHTCTCTHAHAHAHNLYLLHMHTHAHPCLQHVHPHGQPVIQSRYRCLEGEFIGPLTRGTGCQKDGRWRERQAEKVL